MIAAARAFVVAFGVMALWLARDGLNADGIAYLDASDVFLSGRWPESGTGYWSPLYPTLIAIARAIGGTGPATELALVHAVNLVGDRKPQAPARSIVRITAGGGSHVRFAKDSR